MSTSTKRVWATLVLLALIAGLSAAPELQHRRQLQADCAAAGLLADAIWPSPPDAGHTVGVGGTIVPAAPDGRSPAEVAAIAVHHATVLPGQAVVDADGALVTQVGGARTHTLPGGHRIPGCVHASPARGAADDVDGPAGAELAALASRRVDPAAAAATIPLTRVDVHGPTGRATAVVEASGDVPHGPSAARLDSAGGTVALSVPLPSPTDVVVSTAHIRLPERHPDTPITACTVGDDTTLSVMVAAGGRLVPASPDGVAVDLAGPPVTVAEDVWVRVGVACQVAADGTVTMDTVTFTVDGRPDRLVRFAAPPMPGRRGDVGVRFGLTAPTSQPVSLWVDRIDSTDVGWPAPQA